MINIKYEYSGKEFIISPYNTSKEREILLLELLGCEDILDSALHIVGVELDIIESLSEKEKIAILYKYRSVSLGDEIPMSYKCIHCKTPNESTIDINGLITDSSINNDKIVDQFKDVSDSNLNDFITIEVDEMDLDEYEIILNEVKDSITKFNFVRKHICIKCKKENNIDIEDDVISYMSEDSLTSLYQTYNDMTYFGSYTKQDIDSLYPFERTILISLMNKTKEDLSP